MELYPEIPSKYFNFRVVSEFNLLSRNSSTMITRNLLRYLLQEFPFDFVVSYNALVKELDFEGHVNENMKSWYQRNGNVLLNEPFVWKYHKIDNFLKVRGSFLSYDVIFVRQNSNFNWEHFNTYFLQYPDKSKDLNNYWKRWSEYSEYLMTTYIDWCGMVFLAKDRNIISKLEAKCKNKGFNVHQKMNIF